MLNTIYMTEFSQQKIHAIKEQALLDVQTKLKHSSNDNPKFHNPEFHNVQTKRWKVSCVRECTYIILYTTCTHKVVI